MFLFEILDPNIALSSTESEFIQLLYIKFCIDSLFFLTLVLKTLKNYVSGDNRTAINSIRNDSAKSITKHIDIRLKFCGEVIAAGKLKIKYIRTADNIADIFTKTVPAPRFRILRDKIVANLS